MITLSLLLCVFLQRDAVLPRLVRLLNVNRNHYYAHLPASSSKPDTSELGTQQFNAMQYWKAARTFMETDQQLPPLS
jgi:hypothetical protein